MSWSSRSSSERSHLSIIKCPPPQQAGIPQEASMSRAAGMTLCDKCAPSRSFASELRWDLVQKADFRVLTQTSCIGISGLCICHTWPRCMSSTVKLWTCPSKTPEGRPRHWPPATPQGLAAGQALPEPRGTHRREQNIKRKTKGKMKYNRKAPWRTFQFRAHVCLDVAEPGDRSRQRVRSLQRAVSAGRKTGRDDRAQGAATGRW